MSGKAIRCVYCGLAIGGSEVSKDHILPQHRKGLGSKEKNTRKCCKSCNNLKEQAGDCLGALSCASATAELNAASAKALPEHPTPEMLKAACRSIGTAQCAAICLQYSSHQTRDGNCPEAATVWKNRELIIGELRRRPDGPLKELITELLPRPKERKQFFCVSIKHRRGIRRVLHKWKLMYGARVDIREI